MPNFKGSWTKAYEGDATLSPSSNHEGEAMLSSTLRTFSSSPSSSTIPEEPLPLELTSTLKTFSLSPSSSTIPEEPLPLELPTPAAPKHHSSFTLGPLTHEASSSTSPVDSVIPAPDPPPPSSSGNIYPRSQRTTVSSVKSFASSPLKPISPTGISGPSSFPSSPFNRSGSRASTHINRIASEESRALALHHSSSQPLSRGSMILYRCVELSTAEEFLPPPVLHRNSVLSVSGDSIVSLSADSKYPTRTLNSERGIIAYAYDPSVDDLGSAAPAEDDFLHDTDEKFPRHIGTYLFISFRGVINVLALFALIASLLCLFVVYPVFRFYHDNPRNALIAFNTKVNQTGQAITRRSQILLTPISLIDNSTPLHARVLKTAQDVPYGLVFSDEFTQNGRSFGADDDLVWETSGKSYDPSTQNGSLLVRLDTQHREGCIGYGVPDSGGWGGWEDQGDRCLGGILKMKVPLCLSRGGLVEVGLGKTDLTGGVGKGVRRLIFWPGSSDSWSSFNESESPNIPLDLLTSDSDSGSLLLALSIGVLIDGLGRTGASDESRRSRVQVEVDYVRIYQPMLPLPQAVTEEECGRARNDVMLDLLQV